MIWIIRWLDGTLESFFGSKAEVKQYAEKRFEKKKVGYVIN